MRLSWLRILILAGIGVGSIVLTIWGPAVGRCVGVEPEKPCTLVQYAPLSWRAKTITVINRCPGPVTVTVSYRDQTDLPQATDWHEVPAGSSVELRSGDGKKALSYGARYDFKVFHGSASGQLPEPRRVEDMQSANIFTSPEAWWTETTRMRVACR